MPLLKCPPELLQRIVNHLTIPWEYDTTVLDKHALASLCLTCKALERLALPLLYESVSTEDYAINKSAVLLLRTLCTSPELAALVKQLELASDWGFRGDDSWGDNGARQGEWQISPDEAQLFNKGLSEFQISHAGGGGFGDPPADYEQDADGCCHVKAVKAPFDPVCTPDWGGRATAALNALTLCTVPNVQRVQVKLDAFVAAAKPPQLERLKSLSFEHHDTEGGFELEAGLNWLFQAAPALETLSLHMCDGMDAGISHSALTEVVITYSAFQEEGIDALFSAFPRLERLTLELELTSDTYEGMPSPTYVFERALRSHKDRIRYLKLDWRQLDMSLMEWEDDQLSLAQLKRFPNLTELVITGPGLHRTEGDEGDVALYGGFLPAGLEALWLHMQDTSFNPVDLLEGIERAGCTKMKKIVVDQISNSVQEEEFKPLFAAKGIEISLSTSSSWHRNPADVEGEMSDNEGDDMEEDDDGEGADEDGEEDEENAEDGVAEEEAEE